MPELWARDASGINRKFRELWAQDGTGVNRKQKELWANDRTGVNRKIFSSGIICTVDSFYSASLGANPESSMINLSDTDYLRFKIFNATYNNFAGDEYQIRLKFVAPTESSSIAPLVRIQGTWQTSLGGIQEDPVIIRAGFGNFQDEQYSDRTNTVYQNSPYNPISTSGTFDTTLTYAPVSAGSSQWLIFGAVISRDHTKRDITVEFPWSGITWIPTGDQFTI